MINVNTNANPTLSKNTSNGLYISFSSSSPAEIETTIIIVYIKMKIGISIHNVSDKEKYQGLSIRHNGLIVSDLIPFWSMRVHDTDGNDLGEYTVINRDTDYYRSARYYQDEMKNEFSPIRKAEQERLKQNSIEAQQNYEILRQAEEKRQYEEFQKAVNRANLNL